MQLSIASKLESLTQYIDQFEHCAIAVSGGIDSMLLAYLAHRFSNAKVKVVHAFSPAVPEAAYERVKQHAEQFDWELTVIDAQEFDDPNYLSNPVNRCYYCKSNLYSRIAEVASGTIFSGTNLDDLSDVRPGLEAAKQQSVIHPYVHAEIDKHAIYALAKHFGLTEIHKLPAQPCLASRVETGIGINADDLLFINKVEDMARQQLPESKDVRCRITRQGTYLELDIIPRAAQLEPLNALISQMCSADNRVFSGIRRYQKGSAFINGVNHG